MAEEKQGNPAEEEETTLKEFAQLNEQRASTYSFLARLYRKEIDQKLLESLHDTHYPVFTHNKDIDEGYRLIATYLSNLWDDSLTELSIDFTHVFLGGGINAFSAAYPYESVYTSEKRLLMQGARDEVLAIYRANGLDKQDSWKEGEDHISLELEFEQIMALRTAEKLKAGYENTAVQLIKTQKNFLDDHLRAWVPMMTADMKRLARTDMYRGLAYLTDGFLKMDQELLTDSLGEKR